jgi:DNA-binding CsgD family transcriptional regulator/tetratricopeptide (TPR) repeat protein
LTCPRPGRHPPIIRTNDTALIGRTGEVDRLRDLVRDLANGRGGAAWVEGEPGIGKSTVVQAGLADAAALGCQVFTAVADELRQRFPLQVLLDCLGVIPNSPDPARRAISALLRGGMLPGPGAVDPLPAITERLLTLVDRMCAEAPVAVVVDDLQWADEASLLVWHRLGRVVDQQPLLLVSAARPVPRRAEVVQLRRQLVDAGAALIALPPLTQQEITGLAAGLTRARDVGPGLREALDRAGGNPLYVREMVDALVRDGRVRYGQDIAEVADGPDAGGLPDSLVAAISDRLGFVSGPTLGVLRAAALLGPAFLVTDLGTVTGMSVLALADAIDQAVTAGVLLESGSRLAFRHALIRQAVYEATPAALRLALHQQAARALDAAGAPIERVAEQLLAAVPDDSATTGTDDWVIDWLYRNGGQLAYRATTIAGELLTAAVEQLPATDPRREALQASLVRVLFLSGERERRAALAGQVLASTRDPELAAEMSWFLAYSMASRLRHDEAREVIERAVREPAVSRSWAARLHSLLARSAAANGLLAEAMEAAQLALAEATEAGDRLAEAAALGQLGVAQDIRGEAAEALATVRRALGVVSDDPESADIRHLLMVSQVVILANLYASAETETAMRDLLTHSERYGTPSQLCTTRLAVSNQYYATGRWDDALAELEQVAEMIGRIARTSEQWLHGLLALIAAHRDDGDAARAALATEPAEMSANPGPNGEEYVLLARVMLAERAGDAGRAVAILTGMLSHAEHLSDQDLWLPQVVRLALATGDRATAQRAADFGTAMAGDRPGLDRSSATAHYCSGLLEAAPERVLAAAEIYRRAGRLPQLGRALEDAAVLFAERGDLPAARAAYREAADLFTGLGAGWDLLRAVTRLRPYGLRRRGGRRQHATTGWDALTPTELEVAWLLAEGLANPDIAARLFSSRRTVEVHVSHILTKLGMRSRLEIAREADRHPRPAGGAATTGDR